MLDAQLAGGGKWSGTVSARISSARSTRAAAATAARADRRRLASSKLASRLAVARTSRRIRRSSHVGRMSLAPMRVSNSRRWPFHRRAPAAGGAPYFAGLRTCQRQAVVAAADERQRGLQPRTNSFSEREDRPGS